jgi:hypothetical protein
MSCLSSCPNGYFIASGNLCQPITNQTNSSFPQAALTYYILSNQLYVKLSFAKPVQWISSVQSSWMTVTMQSPSASSRLLYQSQMVVTVSNQTATEISFQLTHGSSSINQATLSITLSNAFLSNVADNQTGLLLQQSTFSVSVPYFQPYPPDYIGMGFLYVGQVLCGAVYLLSLGFLAVNRFCELYMLIDVLQELYLVSYLEILYPPNLAEFLAGFKNAHLSFFPNMFSGLFADGYREYNPLKFYELS